MVECLTGDGSVVRLSRESSGWGGGVIDTVVGRAGDLVGWAVGVTTRWGERDLAGILSKYGVGADAADRDDSSSTGITRTGPGAGVEQAGASCLVEVRFHTYYGLLAHVVEREHCLRLPPRLAGRLLRRLHYYNVMHGFLTWYAPVLAVNSRLLYLRQLKRIRHQLKSHDS